METKPFYYLCTCGKMGMSDSGLGVENRYPCEDCLRKRDEEIMRRYGKKDGSATNK